MDYIEEKQSNGVIVRYFNSHGALIKYLREPSTPSNIPCLVLSKTDFENKKLAK